MFCAGDFSSCIETTIPVGLWVIRTAESVVLTDWPPGPGAVDVDLEVVLVDLDLDLLDLRQHRDVAVEVWMRPCDSVFGTRWTRWVPPSYLNTE